MCFRLVFVLLISLSFAGCPKNPASTTPEEVEASLSTRDKPLDSMKMQVVQAATAIPMLLVYEKARNKREGGGRLILPLPAELGLLRQVELSLEVRRAEDGWLVHGEGAL